MSGRLPEDQAPQRPAASCYYSGDSGDAYATWQSRGGMVNGRVNARYFAPHLSRADVVVDFGCGGGELLANLECQRKIGVEVNASARMRAADRGIEVVTSTAELEDRLSDKVISWHALEHTLEPFRELLELRRILTPGGQLILMLPIDDWRRERRPNPADMNHHLYSWTPLLIGHLLTEAGFTVQSCKVVTYAVTRWHLRYFWGVLPPRLFDLVAVGAAAVLCRRQMIAFAQAPR